MSLVLLTLLVIGASCTGGSSVGSGASSDSSRSSAELEPGPPSVSADLETNSGADKGAGPALPSLDVPDNTLVWVHDQEPTSLHYDDPVHHLAVTSWIRRTLLEGLYGVSGATEFYPELLADEGEVVVNGDGSVSVQLALRNGLRWSNGDALQASDVAYTWQIWSEGCERDDDGTIADGAGCVYRGGVRSGLDLVTDVVVTSDTDFTIEFVQFYAGWKGLFDEVYHPSFGAMAADVNAALETWHNADGQVLPSAGPMLFSSWERGLHLSLVRNDDYHGSVSPDARNRGVAEIDGVLVRFVADTETMIRAVEGGEAHVVMSDPHVALGERLNSLENFTVASAAGPIFEHWGFNLLNPHLADPLVREALALAIDKSVVVEELYRPLFGSVLPSSGLGNAYWMTNQRFYENHQAIYAGAQLGPARERLNEAGYETNADGMHVHPERGRLTLRVGTTGGNALREAQQQILVDQLLALGVDARIDNVEGDAYFTAQPFASDALLASVTGGTDGNPSMWDIAQFAWVGSPWPGENSTHYLSADNANPYGFANEDFDQQADTCNATVNGVERAACYNDLDRYLTTLEKGADGLVIIPITQKPSYYGYLSSVLSGAGIGSGADGAGPLANVVDFSFK